MPRGIKNTPPTPPMKAAPPQQTAPAPMIIMQPQADGTRIDAFGLEPAECIDELRRALLHLVARQAGMTIISELVSRQAAIVPAQRSTPPQPSSNGSKPSTGKARRLPIEVHHLDDEPA